MSDTSYIEEPGEATLPLGAADSDDTDPARKALVAQWCARIKKAKDNPKTKGAFARMRKCMTIATFGSEDKTWVDGDNYTAPIIKRHINQAVATLYQRNPKAIAKRKPKMYYKIWDGDPATLQAAMAAMQPPVDPLTGQPAVAQDAMGNQIPWQPDPQSMAIVQEVQEVKQKLLMYDRLGETMGILFAHYLDEQDTGYKEQIKAAVRRAKVNGVAYIKIGFQRQLTADPDIEAQIADVTQQVSRVETLMQQSGTEGFDVESAKAAELKLLLEDLQSREEVIAREGPVLSFPKSTEVIVDPACRHLKTFSGANWIAHEFDLTAEKVMEIYGVELAKGQYTTYTAGKPDEDTSGDKESCAKVWEVQHKSNGQSFVICDGYHEFLKAPAEPDVRIERFWTIVPLVFNEIESDEELYPTSDVWDARHMQREYNNQREALREHRVAARPRYGVPKGALEETDIKAFGVSAPHTVVELNGLRPGDDIKNILQRWPVAQIDPNLYETESTFADIQRAVGSQEANLGGVSGATATETSIAENSRMSASADNTDDLDLALTAMARAVGQLMLLELNVQTVQEIAGPGAVWPQMAPKREEIVKDLFLSVEAGSSGRPNKAADLANIERAAPWLMQMPGLNPTPFLKKGLRLLDIDVEDAIVEGMPSIVALNQMAGSPTPAASSDPNAQGGQGGDNAQRPGGDEGGSQPAFPAPGGGQAPAVN